jgi:H+/Cl- antiporter ClcA
MALVSKRQMPINSRTFVGVYGPNSDRDRKILWDELVAYLVGGICFGVLGVISTLLDFLVRDRVKLACAKLWWSFFILFLSTA